MTFTRPKVSTEVLQKAIEEVVRGVGSRLEKHGDGATISHHESLGIITEEYIELTLATQSNDPVEIAKETMDIIVAGIWGFASMLQKEEELKKMKEDLQFETTSITE